MKCMKYAVLLLALVLPTASAFAQQDGLVNERPLLPRPEYERLWQVDCGAARENLRAAASNADFARARSLLDALRRCAWIDAALEAAPVHAELVEHLEAWLAGAPGGRGELLARLREQG